IDKLAWEVVGAGTAVPTIIYIKETTGSMSVTTWADMINGATEVYAGSLTPTANSWYQVTLNNPFLYQGGNLLVLVATNYGGSGGGTNPTIRYSSSTNNHQTWTADDSAPTGTGSRTSNRPNIRISYYSN